MVPPGTGSQNDSISEHLYSPSSGLPFGQEIGDTPLSPADIEQISRLMRALVALRATEQEILDASEKYMKLSSQDMRALHYLIVARNRGETVTPSMIAAHLGISPASTTKLLNRLERGGHIVRNLHPLDRRAFAIAVTPETAATANETVGKQHARRMHAAARLTAAERETVIGFLLDMAQEISLGDAERAKPKP